MVYKRADLIFGRNTNSSILQDDLGLIGGTAEVDAVEEDEELADTYVKKYRFRNICFI